MTVSAYVQYATTNKSDARVKRVLEALIACTELQSGMRRREVLQAISARPGHHVDPRSLGRYYDRRALDPHCTIAPIDQGFLEDVMSWQRNLSERFEGRRESCTALGREWFDLDRGSALKAHLDALDEELR